MYNIYNIYNQGRRKLFFVVINKKKTKTLTKILPHITFITDYIKH